MEAAMRRRFDRRRQKLLTQSVASPFGQDTIQFAYLNASIPAARLDEDGHCCPRIATRKNSARSILAWRKIGTIFIAFAGSAESIGLD